MGDYALAQKYAQQALAIYQQHYPEELHPQGRYAVALCLRNLAELQLATGTPPEGYEQLSDAYWMQLEVAQNVVTTTPPRTIQLRTQALRGPHDALLTLCWIYRKHLPEATANAFQAVVAQKTITPDTARRLRVREQLEQSDPEFAEAFRRLRPLHRQLLDRDVPLAQESAEERLARLRPVAAERNQLHDELEARIDSAVGGTPSPRIDLTELSQRIPQDSAVVEFVRMTPYVFRAKSNQPAWRTARYLAFVLPAGSVTPQLVDLGPADPIEVAVTAVREHLQEAAGNPDTGEESKLEAEYRELAQALHSLVFAPLTSALGDAQTIFVSPHEALNNIAFEALIDERGDYLIENNQFIYLSSSRDLLNTPSEAASGTIVFASPDFDAEGGPTQVEAKPISDSTSDSDSQSPASTPDARSAFEFSWGASSQSLDEIALVTEALKDHPRLGNVVSHIEEDASEGAFDSLEPAGIIHLSTQTFDLVDPSAIRADEPFIDWDEGDVFLPNDPLDRKLPPTTAARLAQYGRTANRLQACGLALAGANHTIIPANARVQRKSDGLLTTAEIGSANLQQSKLVVLHVWDGDPTDIYRDHEIECLRYAFLQAGSRAFVTNLYAMPDESAQQFFTEFYQRVADDTSSPEAIHGAKRAIIADRRESNGAAHPVHWAGFILSGAGH
ncbi:MAG: CHAT domain-containing protein [Pirellulales bacterium]